jgi:DNA helicase II / ATP-dependent DNA helicase PcrA
MSTQILRELNESQRLAATAIDGPVMIVAGAGSGKTRVLTYRIAYLLQSGVSPMHVLALTFTNKAANEMKERIMRLLQSDRPIPWMGTFHSIFARILRMEAEHIGYERNYSIYDAEDSLALIKMIMNDENISQQQYNPKAIRTAISSAKNRLITPDKLKKSVRSLYDEKTAVIYREYRERLKRNNAMDFDDLITLPITLFINHAEILNRWQDKFEFILVDEYQDTNHAQYTLLNLLAGKRRNICVVGDDSQSIYSFRGADIRNILDFEKDYPDCKLYRLEQNYRSTQYILNAADSVIKNNQQRIPKKLWTLNPPGEPVYALLCADEREEGYRIARTIQDESLRSKRDFNHFVVLYRTNAQSRSIEDGLRRAGIPYTIVGGVEFYKRKEIKDVLAYLRIVVNRADMESILRVINFPPRGIGETTVRRLRNIAEETDRSLIDVLLDPDLSVRMRTIARENAVQFASLINKYRGILDKVSASELARSLIDETGILHMYKEEGTPESHARWENIQELLSAVTEYCEDNPGAGLAEFLESVSLIADVDKWNDERNTITLMTIHSAKGLEFPVVFIAGMEEGLFPLSNGRQEESNIEEERRLCYVGMTRAREKLYLTYTRYRHRFGEGAYPMPSRFIDEINSEYILYRDSAGVHRKPEKPVVRIHRHEQGSETVSHPRRRIHFSYEDESQEVPDLRKGALVEHDTFGRGKVVLISGKGESMKAVVSFDSVGQKSLMLKFARLKIL